MFFKALHRKRRHGLTLKRVSISSHAALSQHFTSCLDVQCWQEKLPLKWKWCSLAVYLIKQIKESSKLKVNWYQTYYSFPNSLSISEFNFYLHKYSFEMEKRHVPKSEIFFFLDPARVRMRSGPARPTSDPKIRGIEIAQVNVLLITCITKTRGLLLASSNIKSQIF